VPDSPEPARLVVQVGPLTDTLEAELFPDWFTAFLHDRQTRKPSAHTMKAYRQDFACHRRPGHQWQSHRHESS